MVNMNGEMEIMEKWRLNGEGTKSLGKGRNIRGQIWQSKLAQIFFGSIATLKTTKIYRYIKWSLSGGVQ